MALSDVTVTFNLADYLGNPPDVRRTKVWLTTNAADNMIADTSTGETRLGGGTVTLAADGTGTATVWAPGPDANPQSWQTTVHVDYADAGTRERRKVAIGPFTISASGTLAALIEEQAVPPTYLSSVTQQLDAKVAEAEAAAAQARDISNIDTSDAVVTTLVQDPASSTASALSASIEASTAGFARPSVGAGLVAALDMNVSRRLVAVVLGDSTGNDWFDWPKRTFTEVANRHPERRSEYALWSDASKTYGTAEVLQEGVDYSPGTPGGVTTVLSDNFNRTASDVIGTTPQTGAAWVGNASNAAGNWSLNGTKLVRETSAAVGAVMSNLGQAGDTVLTLTGVTMSSLPDTANREFNVYFRSNQSAQDGLRLRLQVATSTGNVAYHLFKMAAGASTTLATGTANPIPANTESTTFDVSITTAGNAVTCDVNGVTLAHTLSADDHSSLTGTHVGVGSSGGTLVGTSIDSVTATVDMPATPASGPSLLVRNGSHPGSTLAYQTTNLAAMVPETPDVVIINSGHNYTTTDAATYVATVEQFVTDLRALHPNTPVVVTSQNPEFSDGGRDPAMVTAHADRNAALRAAAVKNGWGYIPGFEAFASKPNGGRAWVHEDGIHPIYDSTGANDGGTLWAAQALAYFTAMSYRTDLA